VKSSQTAAVLAVFIFSMCLTIWLPFAISAGGLNIRASQLVLVPVLIFAIARPPEWRVSVWSILTVAGGALWWLLLLFWTLSNGHDLGHPLARIMLMALNLLQAVLIHVLIVRVGSVRPAIKALFWSVTLLNLMLVLVSAAQAAGVPISSNWLAPEGAPLLVDGEMVDGTVMRFVGGGVLAGCVSAAAAVMAVAFWFDPEWRDRRLLMAAGAVALLGMVIGFSRQSVLSLLFGLMLVVGWLVIRGHLVGLAKFVPLVMTLLVGAGLLVWLMPQGQQFWQAFAGRTAQFADADAYRTGTVRSRQAIWSEMMADVEQNPLLGRGQDSYLRYMGPDEEGAHNFPMEVLHSTGLFGFVGYLLLHFTAPLVAVIWLVTRPSSDAFAMPLIAVFSAYLSIVFASVTNIVYWNPTYWLFLGLMVAAVRLHGRRAFTRIAHPLVR